MPPDVLLPQCSFFSTMTNTNQLHSPAAPGLLHPAHHLWGGCRCVLPVMLAFLFRFIFFQTTPYTGKERVVFTILYLPPPLLPPQYSFPQKMVKNILFAESDLLSVINQLRCKPSSDFLLHSYKSQQYKPPYKPHTVQLYDPGGAPADTTSTGHLMAPLAPTMLLFHLSGSTRFWADIFCISYLTKINRYMEWKINTLHMSMIQKLHSRRGLWIKEKQRCPRVFWGCVEEAPLEQEPVEEGCMFI